MSISCQRFSSVVEPGFWAVYSRKKLEEYKLDDGSIKVLGWYGVSRSANVAPQLRLGSEDFETENHDGHPMMCRGHGLLYNTNTVEDFKNFDKKKLLDDVAEMIVGDIEAGKADQDPSLLVRFAILSYADLKRHKFLYWFCFPSFVFPEGFWKMDSVSPADSLIDGSLMNDLTAQQGRDNMFAIVNGKEVVTLAQIVSRADELTCLCMIDPGNQADHAGWPLFNFLKWVTIRLNKVTEVPILCIRKDAPSSLLFRFSYHRDVVTSSEGKWVGWEPNVKGKMGPRMIDLSAQMDPERLAQSACDLNLKLMRWRALPELDTEMLSQVSCLLVGSGTLGCAVARCLLGWGFRNLTMLDNGQVSYSNPVRQSLFEFQDCINGGKPKAIAAAEALKRIYPSINVQGVQLNIPMPGHFVTNDTMIEETKNTVQQLETLIKEHQVIILLTDTRESRWLPSMLGAKYDKIVLDSALGFDTYMVMRHGCGVGDEKIEGEASEERLGCYFCNDVVAPQNSMKDRTLDQQCTVTRPGLAPIAGALVAELLVGILHHPRQQRAGVDEASGVEKLGVLPHQIRGSLPNFSMMSVSGQAFPQCTACSKCVVDKYDESGFDMLLEAFNNPTYLEDLTGLTDLRNASVMDDLLSLSDESNEEDDF